MDTVTIEIPMATHESGLENDPVLELARSNHAGVLKINHNRPAGKVVVTLALTKHWTEANREAVERELRRMVAESSVLRGR